MSGEIDRRPRLADACDTMSGNRNRLFLAVALLCIGVQGAGAEAPIDSTQFRPPEPRPVILPELPTAPDVDIEGLDIDGWPTYTCATPGPVTGPWKDQLYGVMGGVTAPSRGTGEGSVQYEWRPGGPRAIGGSVSASGALGSITITYVAGQSPSVAYTFGGTEVTGVTGYADISCRGDNDPFSLDQIMSGFDIHAKGDFGPLVASSGGSLRGLV